MMMAERWTRSGPNWIWATWSGDAQLIYLLEAVEPLEDTWMVHKKVSGAADARGQSLGIVDGLEAAQALAEKDAEGPL